MSMNPYLIRIFTILVFHFILIGFLFSKFSLIVGAFEAGLWAGFNHYNFFKSVIGTVLSLIVAIVFRNSKEVLSLISMIIIFALCVQVYKSIDDGGKKSGLAFGLVMLAVLGGVFESGVEFVPISDAFKTFIYGTTYLWPAFFFIGIVMAQTRRRVVDIQTQPGKGA